MQASHPAEPPPIEGAEHHYVDAGGLRVHYAEAGEGSPVLLLHGWPQHHLLWREVIARLRDRHRLIAPDLRGFGWTEAPGHGYDCDTFVRDQVALLDALDIDQVDLIGHDWGGWTAMLLALDQPRRVRRMLLCNEPHPWQGPSLQALRQLPKSWYAVVAAAPVLGPALHRGGAFIPNILGRGNVGTPFSDEEIRNYAACFRDPARAVAASRLYRYYWRAFLQALRGRWADQRLHAPTRLLFGVKDRYISPLLVESGYEDHADEMTVELVPDSGHFIVDERPELVAQRAIELFE
jgi:pimeloyl-ACP methyl ester carboxylesterase